MEFSVQFLANKLSEQREATKMNVERKQARTASEWAEESEDSDLSEEEVEVEDDYQAALYNPKNLPLDWDGKRIPYWLYKLHGLSKYYSCEICDGAQYRGPKAFARHFQEAKHAQGMKLLGIPNTIHFQNVTNKEEAKKLWEKLKLDKQKLMFKPDQEEEYEDSLGNVVSKRIYEDLKNNNLL
ncbi:splicing factor 3A subunit 3-like [Zophobas morio]|uniref:splicing factor 3A subunit 3-like n=1 Tax=Zophobas morio TaxID=2755281 RepID=UPI003082B92B